MSWICWRSNIDGRTRQGTTSAGLSASVIRAADSRSSVARILLDDSSITASALTRILNNLLQAWYDIRVPVETDL